MSVIKQKKYDMDKQEWRSGGFKPLDRWVSTKRYGCNICGIKSDRWVLGGGYWGLGPRLRCHVFNKFPEDHNRLQRILWEAEDTASDATRRNLEKEALVMRSHLLKKFHKIKI